MSPALLNDEQMAHVLAALESTGADLRCPSCQGVDWSGWQTGAIASVTEMEYAAEHRDEELPDYIGGDTDWAHALKVLALICKRCGFLRLHAPSALGRGPGA